jgi:hypothetical protein
MTDESSEAQEFDAGVRKMLSVSCDELLKREQEWKDKRARQMLSGARENPHSKFRKEREI